jgi:uncharacterized protein (TIGR04255 family)
MASRGRPIPKKLKHDAIVEALLEIRFDTETIPEILFGQLADYEPWKGFTQQRLPFYDIPAPIRQADPNLRFHPLFELRGEQRIVRVGTQSISYHRAMPYVGWTHFEPELHEVINGLFEKAKGLVVRRLGLRYLNALRSDLHGIRSISDLDLDIRVAGETAAKNVNLNFTVDVADETACTVRIATLEFIQGPLPVGTTVYIDVDVFTKEGFQTKERSVVETWTTEAHTKEKEQFFGLLTDKTIEELEEK